MTLKADYFLSNDITKQYSGNLLTFDSNSGGNVL